MDMWEYDPLTLDVAEQVAAVRQQEIMAPIGRKASDCSRRRNCPSIDAFDCASSGYGSPGQCSTPLPSPAFGGADRRQSAGAHDIGFFDFDLVPADAANNSSQSAPAVDLSSWLETAIDKCATEKQTALIDRQVSVSSTRTTTAKTVAEEAAGVGAEDDGFSADEIVQFAQLLSCPKKAPPSKYQCHICYQSGHYISDCPMRFNCPYEELTPYQGRKKCYGEFQCQHCKRKWTSQNSIANEAQSCIKCHVAVFPHKQLPVDKAIAMGYIKTQKAAPVKQCPIGHGRRPLGA